MNRSIAIAVLLAGALAGAAWLKVARYAADGEGPETRFVPRLETFLAKHGWRRLPEGDGDVIGSARVLRFAKSQCERPLLVAVVGRRAGIDTLLRLAHGDDMAFLQNGEFVARPNQMRLQLDAALQGVAHQLGWGRRAGVPLLALDPVPPAASVPCAAPRADLWRALSKR